MPRLPVGLHAAGGATGLYLRVAPTGARNWILRVVIGARRRDMGLGGWPDVATKFFDTKTGIVAIIETDNGVAVASK